MTSKRCLLTIFLIATTTMATGASAENVYKCGSTYSQSPCPGAKVLSVDDSRDPEQKKLKDDITRRDAELASDMEKTRLANEAALAAERAKDTKEAKNAAKTKPTQDTPAEPVVVYAHKPRLHKPHKPEAFIAIVPGTVHKPAKSHKKLPENAL